MLYRCVVICNWQADAGSGSVAHLATVCIVRYLVGIMAAMKAVAGVQGQALTAFCVSAPLYILSAIRQLILING